MAEELIVALDPGSAWVTVLVASLEPEKGLSLLAAVREPSPGLRHGAVVNIEQTAHAISVALDHAEQISGREIARAYVGAAGRHLESRNTHGAVSIAPGGREIAGLDVEHAIEAAREQEALGENRKLLHQLPRGYVVDEQDGVLNPIGMAGYHLEAETHLITGSLTMLQNLAKCVELAQLELNELVCAPLAAAAAVLTPAEREMGVLVLDIGSGTTGIALYANGFPWHTAELPVGGADITHALVVGLLLPPDVAEHLKVTAGRCDAADIADDELIELNDESLVLPRGELTGIITASATDLLAQVRAPLRAAQRAGVTPMGIVLTGGGAELEGIAELAQRALGLPARVGAPYGLRAGADGASGPAFATAAGLLIWGARRATQGQSARGWRERAVHLVDVRQRLGRFARAFLP